VWAVIAAHAEKTTGQAFPSVDRITGLAGVRKTAALNAIKTLEEGKYITVHRSKFGNTYVLQPYKTQPGEWISIPASLFMTGTWAFLPRSAQVCYFYFCALALPGQASAGRNADADADVVDYDYDFIPLNRVSTQIPGLPPRTARAARAWLARYGLIQVCDMTPVPGLALPHSPPVPTRAGEVLEKIKNRMEKKRTSRTLRALAAAQEKRLFYVSFQ
jgi:hypothetical protein